MVERTKRARHAAGMYDRLLVVNFAGGGGACRGIEAGFGRAVDIAINHDANAVAMHKANHPHTLHLQEDVFHVDPDQATAGRPVGLAWFSPDCTHFSRAKGGKPVKKKIRGLAWVVIRWAKRKKPDVIMLENVREFEFWGPLTPDDRPCPLRKGQTFKKWVSTLRNLSYIVEWRTLNASDFGAPTHRRRLFLIARCDGEAIVWPEPTHGPGRSRPYNTAAQCIDWSLPCPSIFLTREEGRKAHCNRPLAEKTMKRIAMGIKRFVLENPKPFIVQPLTTITSKAEHCIAAANLIEMHFGDKQAFDVAEPLRTVLAGANHHGLVLSFLSKYFGRGIGQKADDPLHTVTAKARFGLVTVKGQDYAIVDIGLRMLRPRELFRCQGFDDSYLIDPIVNGRRLPASAQVKLCGNSVCPAMSEALVRANFPDECRQPAKPRKGAAS